MQETTPPSPHTSSTDDGSAVASSSLFSSPRFSTGTLIAGRYRIVSTLGRGGMGEVYRADDLTLGTSVALKFLPEHRAHDPLWRDRLLKEVRTAREVTHPNVCRVFDLVESDGQFFLSMEYIDGEDLASLLRRIGRFPEDKAFEIARQICLGLAAAHEEGILHRDLKPANVMLDGRGRIKLTDFGLATLGNIEGPEARAGTHAYMAPEQREGKEATRKSDLYALGLVLHEVFTGKKYDARPDRQSSSARNSSTIPSLSSNGIALDPAAERILARCLASDPRDRPATAFAVAAALPGADPLQAALDAGQTPSPQMVAEARDASPLSKARAITLLLVILVSVVIHFALWESIGFYRHIPLSIPPVALADRARLMAEELGRPLDGVPVYGNLVAFTAYQRPLIDRLSRSEYYARLAAPHPGTRAFAARFTRAPLTPYLNYHTAFTLTFPEMAADETQVAVSTAGYLVEYRANAPQLRPTTSQPASAQSRPVHFPILDTLSRLTGLDIASMNPVTPRWHDVVPHDKSFAFAGNYPEPNADLPVRIEYGTRGNDIAYVRVFRPLELPQDDQPPIAPATAPPKPTLIRTMLDFLSTVGRLWGPPITVALILISCVLAVRHLRGGVADISGGLRLAAAISLIGTVSWLLSTRFPPDIATATDHLMRGLPLPFFNGLCLFGLYIALEPFVRSAWPAKLVGWTRLNEYRLTDAFVHTEILLGITAGCLAQILAIAPYCLIKNGLVQNTTIPYEGLDAALGLVLSRFASDRAMMILFVVAAARHIFGRRLAYQLLAFPLVFILLSQGYLTPATPLGLLALLLPALVIMFVAVRFGFLALLTAVLYYGATITIPVTTSFDSYFFPSTIAVTTLLLIPAFISLYFALPRPADPAASPTKR